MSSVNKAFLMGKVENDPVVKIIPNGSKTASFRLCTVESFNGRDGARQERTEWHNIACWGQAADAADGLSKGDVVHVEGRIQTRSWEDAQSGQRKYMTEINVRELIRVGAGQTQGRPEEQYGRGRSQYPPPAAGGGGGGGGRRSGPNPEAGRSNPGRQGKQPEQNDQAFDDDVPF